MSNVQRALKMMVRLSPALLGVGLLAYLVLRAGPRMIWNQVQIVGWGLLLIIALAGVAHLLKTWAWRLTFTCDLNGLSWSRSVGMRLVSEAIGQVGFAGKVFGEGVRVSLLGSAAPIEHGISSAALDSGLYTVTAAMVTVGGIVTTLFFASLSGKWRLYSWLLVAALAGTVALAAVAMSRRWKLMGTTARTLGRIPAFSGWVSRKQSVIDSTEHNLLTFHRVAPAAFWTALILNIVCHVLAISEVYLILRFMGVRVTFVSAFMLEALTKVINLVGALNPGNVGTYEGGTMLVTKLFGITGTLGLTLALCRRARAIFWAAIGAVCLVAMKRPGAQDKQLNPELAKDRGSSSPCGEMPGRDAPTSNSQAVIILADCHRNSVPCSPLLRVGTLPIILRTILTVKATEPARILVCAPAVEAPHLWTELRRTRRVPAAVEFRELGGAIRLPEIVSAVARECETVMLLDANRTYQLTVLQSAAEWRGSGALALATDGQAAGAYVLSHAAALELVQADVQMDTLPELQSWIDVHSSVQVKEIPAESWHAVLDPEDIREAERKLDAWLIKPTDGLYARMNRHVSIPISHQLIKLPITPNMVTMFTLGVSIASGVFFARGGYWNMLFGAVLSVWASILDGCDGEVARLKLQSTKLGCWLDTICDYLYYVIVFVAIPIGLRNSSGLNALRWGTVLLVGAALSFVVVGMLRRRMTQERPDSFLAVWQKKADTQRSNPLVYLARNCEFIIRRCFFPYALLAFAALNIIKVAFVATAIGANLVWMIALYSRFALSQRRPALLPAPSGSCAADD